MTFDVKNKCIRKKFQECHMKDVFNQKCKRNLVFENFIGCYFLRIL